MFTYFNKLALVVLISTIAWSTEASSILLSTGLTGGGGGGGGDIIQFVVDPSSDTQGIQEVINSACTASDPVVIEFAAGTVTIDATGLSDGDMAAGVIQFPDNCDEVTLRGAGNNTTVIEVNYTLNDSDNTADQIDLKVVRIRGSNWIKFEDIQFAFRNTCNDNYIYDGVTTEKCISDGKIGFSIEAAPDGTLSQNITFDSVHIHMPSTYDPQGRSFNVIPNAIRAVDSDTVNVIHSIIHNNGFGVLVDDCEACTVNYNYFQSTFPLSEGPVGRWHDPSPPYVAPVAADLSDADYTSETQSFIVLGVGQGKQAIGNRINAARLKFEDIELRGSNSTGAITMSSLLDLTGVVPRGALVANNVVYDVMDISHSMFYFINYNAAIVTGNSISCHDLVNSSNCEGGGIMRMINTADDDPATAYNRENTFIGNAAWGFPTDYDDEVIPGNFPAAPIGCISIFGPQTDDVAAFGSDSHTDNTFIGNTCDTQQTLFAVNGLFGAVVGVDVINDQFWGSGNIDLSTGAEFRPGPGPIVVSRTAKLDRINGHTLTNAGEAGAVVLTLPGFGPESGGQGVDFQVVNVTGTSIKLCATGQYFVGLNLPHVNNAFVNHCIESDTLNESIRVTQAASAKYDITDVTLGSTTTLTYTEGGSNTLLEVGERIHIEGILPARTHQLNNREYLISAQSGTGAGATITITDLNGAAINSTGWPTHSPFLIPDSGTIQRFNWFGVENVGWVTATP